MTTTSGAPESFQPQGPGSYQTGMPTGPHQPPAAPTKERNTIGLVALVVAILGFIFAVWEGAYLLGWILLPIAFILSLVALFAKGKPKRMAIAALIISIVGTVAGAVAFVSSAATAFDEAFTNETTVSEPAITEPLEEPAVAEAEDAEPQETGETAEEPASPDEPAATEQGTRENPAPLGATASSDDWDVTVNSFTADATAEIMAENQFNDAPEEGFVYALVNVTVQRLAAESGFPMEISVGYVTDGGNVVTAADAMAVAPESLSSFDELYEGAEVTGNVALMIPEGDAGTIRVSPGLFADDVFFATT